MTNTKKHLSKIGVILLSLMMILVFSAPMISFAGNATEEGTMTINDIDPDAVSVTAYKLIVPTTDVNGDISGWTPANNSVKNVFNGKYSEIPEASKFVNLDTSGLQTISLQKSGASWTAQAPAGLYMVKVKTNGAYVYNPILIGMNLDAAGKKVEANTFGVEGKKYNETGYAKKNKPTVTKTVTDNAANGTDKASDTSANIGGQSQNWNTVADKNNIGFNISATIANYSDEYKNLSLTLSDTLSEGLTLNHEGSDYLKVSIDGAPVPADKYNVTNVTDRGFVVNFTDTAWIKANGGKTVTVTYTARLNENAKQNFNPNTNEVTYKFTNNPDGSTGETKDKTYHYTFDIDGDINGPGSWITKEVIKTGDEVVKTGLTDNKPLQGATFELTNTVTGEKKVVTSDANGLLPFKGLDANVEYKLVETAAPGGYFPDNTERSLKIVASFNADGTLQKYHVVIDGKSSPEYVATYDNGTLTNIKVGDKSSFNFVNQPTGVNDTDVVAKDQVTEIKNSKSPTLPTTGGIGTMIFTVGGIAIIAIAAVLYFRKKNNNEA